MIYTIIKDLPTLETIDLSGCTKISKFTRFAQLNEYEDAIHLKSVNYSNIEFTSEQLDHILLALSMGAPELDTIILSNSNLQDGHIRGLLNIINTKTLMQKVDISYNTVLYSFHY